MNHGKQIRLFLMDGSPSGMRYAVNWTGQVFACPSGFFGKLKDWTETQRPGVYVLLGVDAQGEDIAYIGESENVAQRLLTHVLQGTLEEIVEAFFFTSKDDNLTKSHINYLEKQLIVRASTTNRYPLKNDVLPTDKTLSKPELATMKEFLDNVLLVAESLGYNVFASNTNVDQNLSSVTLYAYETETGLTAQGWPDQEGFVVKAGSKAKTGIAATSLGAGYNALRQELVKTGVLINDPTADALIFSQDYLFRSSTAAISIVVGYQKSGPSTWRRSDGKLLEHVEADEAGNEVDQLVAGS